MKKQTKKSAQRGAAKRPAAGHESTTRTERPTSQPAQRESRSASQGEGGSQGSVSTPRPSRASTPVPVRASAPAPDYDDEEEGDEDDHEGPITRPAPAVVRAAQSPVPRDKVNVSASHHFDDDFEDAVGPVRKMSAQPVERASHVERTPHNDRGDRPSARPSLRGEAGHSSSGHSSSGSSRYGERDDEVRDHRSHEDGGHWTGEVVKVWFDSDAAEGHEHYEYESSRLRNVGMYAGLGIAGLILVVVGGIVWLGKTQANAAVAAQKRSYDERAVSQSLLDPTTGQLKQRPSEEGETAEPIAPPAEQPAANPPAENPTAVVANPAPAAAAPAAVVPAKPEKQIEVVPPVEEHPAVAAAPAREERKAERAKKEAASEDKPPREREAKAEPKRDRPERARRQPESEPESSAYERPKTIARPSESPRPAPAPSPSKVGFDED